MISSRRWTRSWPRRAEGLACSRIVPGGILNGVAFFGFNPSLCLTEIYASSGSGCGDALGSFVRNCPQLRTLSLAWNKLGHHGATQVVQPMVDSTGAGIRDLDLSWNNLQNAGAQAVGDVVRASTCLLNLNMAHNGVGSTGSIVLAAGLQSSTVHVLNMAGNPVGKGGARALLRCVGMDSGCRDIDLSGCAMEADDSFDPSKPAGT